MGNTRTGRSFRSTLAIAIAVSMAGAMRAQAPLPPAAGLSGWWALDGTGEDFGPAAMHGAFVGSGGGYEAGEVLQGMRAAAPDGRMAIADATPLHVHDHFTYEMWVRLDRLSTGLTYLVNKGTTNHRATPYAIGVIGSNGLLATSGGSSVTGTRGAGRPFLVLSDGALEQVLIGNAALPLGNFVHLACTVHPQGTATQAHIYLNGVQVIVAFLGRLPFAGTQSLQLAGVGGGAPIDGVLDEVTLYDRALSVAEIQAIVAAGPAGKVKPNRDHTPPVLGIAQPLDGAVVGSHTVGVQVAVSDDSETSVTSVPTGVVANLPAGGGVASGNVELIGGDGDFVIAVQANDAANNQAATSVTVTLDTAAPSVAIATPGEGAVVGNSPVSFAVQVADLTATSLTLAGQARSLPPGQNAIVVDVPLVAGDNAIVCAVIDAAGNPTTVIRHVVLDVEAPLLSIVSPPDGALYGAGQPAAAVIARVDDLTITTVTSSPTGINSSLPAGGGLVSGALPLHEGLNPLALHATDQLGHGADAVITVNLDTTAPALAFGSPSDNALVRGTIEVLATANDIAPGSGVLGLDLFVDGRAFAATSGSTLRTDLDTAQLGDGSHLLLVTAGDGAGNVATARQTIRVDNTPPDVRVLTPLPNDVVRGRVAFTATGADSLSGLVTIVQRVGGRAPSHDGSLTFAPPVPAGQANSEDDSTEWPNGSLQYEVDATDDAGNTAHVLVPVTVDNLATIAPPGLCPRDGARVRDDVRLQLVTDRPDVTRLELFVDGQRIAQGQTSPLAVRVDTSRRLDGPMVVRGVVHTTGAGVGETTHTLHVDNLRVDGVQPHELSLTAGSAGRELRVLVRGASTGLLASAPHTLRLSVPGGGQLPLRLQSLSRGHEHDRLATLVGDRGALVAALLAARATGALSPRTHHATLRVLIDGVDIGGELIELTESCNGRR